MRALLTSLLSALLLLTPALPASAADNPFDTQRFRVEQCFLSWNALFGQLWLDDCVARARGQKPPKVNLTGYLGQVPNVGDVSFFGSSTGEVIRTEILDVALAKRGFRFVGEKTIDGKYVGAAEGIVIPGKKTRILSENIGGVQIDLKRPMTTHRYRTPLRNTRRIRGVGSATVDGLQRKARYKGTVAFRGFRTLETPVEDYPGAAELESTLTLSLEKGAAKLKFVVDATRWYTRQHGLVATTERLQVQSDGELLEDSGPVDTWRIEAPAP